MRAKLYALSRNPVWTLRPSALTHSWAAKWNREVTVREARKTDQVKANCMKWGTR